MLCVVDTRSSEWKNAGVRGLYDLRGAEHEIRLCEIDLVRCDLWGLFRTRDWIPTSFHRVAFWRLDFLPWVLLAVHGVTVKRQL
jgi:hypothetical protein